MPTWPQASLSTGFKYVQDTVPQGPEEGETWYDLGADEAKVYDGANWHLLTVTDHSEVGGVQVGQHRSDSNVRATVDGQVDADTVDGQHASQLGGSLSTTVVRESESGGSGNSRSGSTNHNNAIILDAYVEQNTGGDGGNICNGNVTFNFADGGSAGIGFGAYANGGTKNEGDVFRNRAGSTALVDSVDWSVDGNSYGGHIIIRYAVAEL